MDLASMIRCPVTKSDLTIAETGLIESINQWIEENRLFNHVGQIVDSKIESGYINEDASLLLPIRGGIVILISDQAIPLGQLSADPNNPHQSNAE